MADAPAQPAEATPAALRVVERVTAAAGALAAILLAALAGMMLAELGARNLLGRSLHVTWELSGYAMGGVFFLGAASALRHGEHVRVGIVLEAADPRAARWIDLAATAAGLLVALYLAVALGALSGRSLAGDVRSWSGFRFPLWAPQALLALGAALLALQLSARAARLALGLPPDLARPDPAEAAS